MKKLIFFGVVILTCVALLGIVYKVSNKDNIEETIVDENTEENISDSKNESNELEKEENKDNEKENKLVTEEKTIENLYGVFGHCVTERCDPNLTYDLTFEDVKNMIVYGMTFDEVVELIGKPQEEFGSGAIWFQWNLVDGTMFCLQFSRMNLEEPINQIHVIRLSLVS